MLLLCVTGVHPSPFARSCCRLLWLSCPQTSRRRLSLLLLRRHWSRDWRRWGVVVVRRSIWHPCRQEGRRLIVPTPSSGEPMTFIVAWSRNISPPIVAVMHMLDACHVASWSIVSVVVPHSSQRGKVLASSFPTSFEGITRPSRSSPLHPLNSWISASSSMLLGLGCCPSGCSGSGQVCRY